MATSERLSDLPESTGRFERWSVWLQIGVLGVVAIGIGWHVWNRWLRESVSVRPAGTADRIDPALAEILGTHPVLHTIAVVDGKVAPDTWLAVSLYAVRGGRIDVVNQITAGCDPPRPGTPPRVPFRVVLGLCEADTADGRTTQLVCAGSGRESAGTADCSVVVPDTYRYVYTGILIAGRDRIIYVQGTQPIHVGRATGLKRFARTHNGDYLVVTAKLL